MAEKLNNIKRLMETDYEARFELPPMGENDPIETKLLNRHASNRFNSDVTELFLPKMIRSIVGIFGGEVADDNTVFNRPAPSDYGKLTPQSRPKGPNEK